MREVETKSEDIFMLNVFKSPRQNQMKDILLLVLHNDLVKNFKILGELVKCQIIGEGQCCFYLQKRGKR